MTLFGRGVNFVDNRYSFDDLIKIISTLRSENGCPWDKVQTHESLKPYMLEEAYEVIEAVDNKDSVNLCEELGDVLLQVALHSQIASEKDNFTIEDVVSGICSKMIYRHPHIFSTQSADTEKEVLKNWEEIKKQEKGLKTQTEVLKSVPKAMPGLLRAMKVQKKASDVNFDFSNISEVFSKVYEEIDELKEAIEGKNGNILDEFGDCLFSMVNLARFLQINPEIALTKSTEKFINRFEYVESLTVSLEKSISSMSTDELNSLWEKSKQHENINSSN